MSRTVQEGHSRRHNRRLKTGWDGINPNKTTRYGRSQRVELEWHVWSLGLGSSWHMSRTERGRTDEWTDRGWRDQDESGSRRLPQVEGTTDGKLRRRWWSREGPKDRDSEGVVQWGLYVEDSDTFRVGSTLPRGRGCPLSGQREGVLYHALTDRDEWRGLNRKYRGKERTCEIFRWTGSLSGSLKYGGTKQVRQGRRSSRKRVENEGWLNNKLWVYFTGGGRY